MSSAKKAKNEKPEGNEGDQQSGGAPGSNASGGTESGGDAGESQGSDQPSAGANDDPAPSTLPPVPSSVSGDAPYHQPEDTVGFAMPIPTIGRIVLYCLTAEDAADVNRRREHRGAPVLGVAHVGNVAHEGDVLPMLIVAVWGANPAAAVNGQVFLDGNDTLWVRSVVVGNEPGHFNWPHRG